ncbi:MAG TPA: SulP family inorganic anion transporter [Candidatus Limnocylindrales bacterium]
MSSPARPASRRFPLFRGMAGLRRENIPREILAGVTIACVAVPLGLGYGAMAGLPPEVGIYGTILPLAAYAILGSSRRIVMAPDSALALIIAGSVVPLAAGNAERAFDLAMLTALVAGVILLLGGLLKVGALAEYVSRPVLIGYLSGVGIDVVSSQIPRILTISGEGDTVIERAVDYVSKLDQANVPSLVLGVGAIAGMLALNRVTPNLPIALVVVVVGTIVASALALGDAGVELVGQIPSGFPGIDLPPLDPSDIVSVALPALAIAILSFVDSSLTARSFGARHGEDVDTDSEAIGIGAADIAASISSGLPASGSGLRTSLAEAAGATTQLAPLVSAGILVLVLVFLTGVLALMPWPVLAGILVVAGLGIVDIAALRTLARLDRAEFRIAMIALLGVVFVGTFAGVFIAIFLSMLDVIRRLASPAEALIGETAGPASDGDLVLVYRFDAPLFFGNAELLRVRVRRLAMDRDHRPRVVVLDGGGITTIDTTAAYALARLRDELRSNGMVFVVAGLPTSVRERLVAAGREEPEIGEFEIHDTLDGAVAASSETAAERPT